MIIGELNLTNNSITHTIEDGCKISGLNFQRMLIWRMLA